MAVICFRRSYVHKFFGSKVVCGRILRHIFSSAPQNHRMFLAFNHYTPSSEAASPEVAQCLACVLCPISSKHTSRKSSMVSEVVIILKLYLVLSLLVVLSRT